MSSDITQRLSQSLQTKGLIVRGGFHTAPDDGLGEGTLIMVGNAGRAIWDVYRKQQPAADNPLDTWTRQAIDPIADRLGAKAVYPFDRPHPPFQQWARRAEGLAQSPIGILIHPEFGLWHAYRAALIFPHRFAELENAPELPKNPCESCSEKPCLNACPVDAFSPDNYDVEACAGHILAPAGRTCVDNGCAARNACPVGQEFRYSEPQIRFHMAAFARSLARR